MTGFRIAALALPAAVAFLAPALWAWRPGWKPAAIGAAGLVAVVTAWGLLAGAPGAALLATAVLSLAFGLFGLGLYFVAGQVVSGLVVVLLCATLFFTPQAVDDAVTRGPKGAAQERVDFLVSINPWTVLAVGPFQIDLFRDFQSMYRSHVADYAEARPSAWGGVAAGYAIGGLALIGAAALGRRLRRPPSTINNPQSSP